MSAKTSYEKRQKKVKQQIRTWDKRGLVSPGKKHPEERNIERRTRIEFRGSGKSEAEVNAIVEQRITNFFLCMLERMTNGYRPVYKTTSCGGVDNGQWLAYVGVDRKDSKKLSFLTELAKVQSQNAGYHNPVPKIADTKKI
tara:strand:- start:59 stop:481 length:423 start_codon:yes stop_codon:yes gene_type:complete